ncbi:MAG: glycoside hydrolase family 99-like domain-containing protein [Fimbriimonadales bacterium]
MITLLAALTLLPQESMDAATAAKTRYNGDVAIWYGSHFEDTAAHDWVPIKEWNGPFHPLLGDYKTDDRKVVRKHLEWLRRAGVDVILYDVCRIQPELTLFDLPKQKTLRLLVDELSHQQKETRKLKLALWIEKWNSNPTAEQYRFGLEYIRTQLADKDFYYRLEGKPFVLRYLNDPAPDFSEIDAQNAPYLTLRKISPTTGVVAWGYFFSPAASPECMTVNPGADGYMEGAFIESKLNHKPIDEKALREHGKAVEAARRDGMAFEDQLRRVRAANPRVIFISGWNDWAYCMQIEPSKEYGFRYVDAAARLLGRSEETAPYR